MRTKRSLSCVFLAVFWFGTCAAVQAGILDWWRGRRVDVLMITGNYAKSRLLAELAQFRTKQPVILVSPARAGDRDELYFLPSAPEAMSIEKPKFVEFVSFLQPKRIVVLGDSSYVPTEYLDLLRDRFPVLVVAGKDWHQNAQALAKIVGNSGLPKRYLELLARIEEAHVRQAYTAETGIMPPAQPEPLAPAPAAPLAPAPAPAVPLTSPDRPLLPPVSAPAPAMGMPGPAEGEPLCK
jgi:hypothetical protein